MYRTWHEAHAAATKLARLLGKEVGLWKANEFGRTVYNVRSLPKPENRYGHELRCELVAP